MYSARPLARPLNSRGFITRAFARARERTTTATHYVRVDHETPRNAVSIVRDEENSNPAFSTDAEKLYR